MLFPWLVDQKQLKESFMEIQTLEKKIGRKIKEMYKKTFVTNIYVFGGSAHLVWWLGFVIILEKLHLEKLTKSFSK